MLKRFLYIGVLLILLFLSGCDSRIQICAGKDSYEEKGVSITDKGNYFDVILDYNSGLTHRQMGEAFARAILQVVPDYEFLVDSYISENLTSYEYPYSFYRVEDIKPQIIPEYLDEIEGMASVFSGGDKNGWKDGKISKDEFFLFNLFTDAVRNTQCSFVSVFGSGSETSKTITARNLDWYGGSVNQLPRIQTVITIKYPGSKICSVGYLGYMGILSGFNDSKVFAAILDAGTNAPYSSEGRRSYVLDLRFALENYRTMDEVAGYMKDNKKLYAFNHNIGFSDPEKSIVLENNFSGYGSDNQRVKRTIRESDSKLNNGITWDINNAIAAVNSFVLYGNYDNQKANKYNTYRWKNIKTQLLAKGDKVSEEELKEVTAYNHGKPGVFSESGDLYNRMTIQMIIFQPDTFSLKVFFRPKDIRRNPIKPVFEEIPAFK